MKKCIAFLYLFCIACLCLSCISCLHEEEALFPVWVPTWQGIKYKVDVTGGDRRYGFIDESGKCIIPLEYDYAFGFAEGLAHVSKDGRGYYINKENEVVLELGTMLSSRFSDGYARVSEKGLYGYIDKSGRVVIPLIYKDAMDFSEGLAFVKEEINGKMRCIDKENNIIFEGEYKKCNPFKNGYAIVHKKNGKESSPVLLDRSGKEYVLPTGYEMLVPQIDRDGNLLLKKNDSFFLYSIKHNSISRFFPDYEVFTDSETSKEGLKDRTGRILIEPMYDFVRLPDNDGFVHVGIWYESEEKFKEGFLSTTGDVLIPIEFEILSDFENNLAAFLPYRSNGGYVSRKGQIYYYKDYMQQ